jgi:hypothetical protein
MAKIPKDFGSCLMPSDGQLIDNQDLLDVHTDRLLANQPRNRFGPAPTPDGSNPDGNPFAATQPLMSPTLGYPTKAESAAALRKSIFASSGMTPAGRSHEKTVLDLIQKILQKAGR